MARTPPLISYVNVLADAEITASAETDDGFAANAVDGVTYDYWIPGAAANIEFQLDAEATIECFAVAAHTLVSDGANITLEYWDGAQWVTASQPSTGFADVTLFDFLDNSITADLFRVSVSAACSIGVVWAGPVMQMDRNLYQGHTPITMAERSSQRANKTETGEWRGVASTIRGAELDANFDNLDGSWVRSTFAPFVDHFNDGGAFFWAWYIDKYPTEVAYCWNPGNDLTVENSGPRDLMSTTIRAGAYIDGPPAIAPKLTTTVYPMYLFETADVSGVSLNSADVRDIIVESDLTETASIGGATVTTANLRDITIEYSDSETANVSGVSITDSGLRNIRIEYSDSETANVSGVSVTAAALDDIVIRYDDGETANVGGVTVTGAALT